MSLSHGTSTAARQLESLAAPPGQEVRGGFVNAGKMRFGRTVDGSLDDGGIGGKCALPIRLKSFTSGGGRRPLARGTTFLSNHSLAFSANPGERRR